MARTTTAAQDAALEALNRQTHVRVKYEDPDGTMQTIHNLLGVDYFDSLEIESNADQPISQATFTFWRSSGATSLAPLIEASMINRTSGGQFASALLPVRQITVEVATMLPGSTPAGSDWMLIWEGEIDELDWAGEQIIVECLDPMTALNRHIIQTVATYGDDGGSKNIDDVMQDILDAEFGAGTWPITVVGTPILPIAEYELGNISVLAALMALADLIGWSLHWLWDASAAGFRLTFYEPDRAATAAVYTFWPDDYYVVNRMGTGVRGIRNVGEVLYTDTSGAQQSVSDTRSTSVADFGESFIRIDAQGSSVVNATQANNLLAAVLDDTEDPKVEQEIEAAFHWPIELGDVHTYKATEVHYDTDQTWASFGYRHIIEPDRRRTIIQAAGKPSGGFRRWLAKDTTARRRPPGSRALAGVEVTFNANGQAVVSAAAEEQTEAIYVTVGDGSAPADPTATTNDGVITGPSGTVDTGVKITTGREAYVKAVAVSGQEFVRVSSARQARRTGPFHKDTTTRSHTGDLLETTLETITIPAGTLGADGSLRIELRYDLVGTAANKTLRVKLNTDTIFGQITSSEVDIYGQVLLFNDGAANDQQAVGFQALSSGSVNLINNSTLAEDSTADMDIVITAQLGNAADQIDLILTHVTLIGTD